MLNLTETLDKLYELIVEKPEVYEAITVTDPDCLQIRWDHDSGFFFMQVEEIPEEEELAALKFGAVYPDLYSEEELWYYGSLYHSDREVFDLLPLEIKCEYVFESEPLTRETILVSSTSEIYDAFVGIMNTYGRKQNGSSVL